MNTRKLLTRAATTMLLVCSVSVLTGCRPKVKYLTGTDRVIYLPKGDPAPFTGYLLTPTTMSNVYDKLGEKLKVPE